MGLIKDDMASFFLFFSFLLLFLESKEKIWKSTYVLKGSYSISYLNLQEIEDCAKTELL